MKKFVAKANQRISENRNIGKRLKSGHNHWISSTTHHSMITVDLKTPKISTAENLVFLDPLESGESKNV